MHWSLDNLLVVGGTKFSQTVCVVCSAATHLSAVIA